MQKYILLLQEVPFKVESYEKNLIAKVKQGKHRGETRWKEKRWKEKYFIRKINQSVKHHRIFVDVTKSTHMPPLVLKQYSSICKTALVSKS